MKIKQFIDEYSWQRAKDMQMELLSLRGRMPKSWTFVERNGDQSREFTIYFDMNAPTRSSAKMLLWLRANYLWFEAMEEASMFGFSARERIKIIRESVYTQLGSNVPFLSAEELHYSLWQMIEDNKFYKDGLDLFSRLKTWFEKKCQNDDLSNYTRLSYIYCALLCNVHLIDLTLKTLEKGKEPIITFGVEKQFSDYIDKIVAKEEEEKDYYECVSVSPEIYKKYSHLFSLIENIGNNNLTRLTYESAIVFYKVSGCYSLAEHCRSVLKD